MRRLLLAILLVTAGVGCGAPVVTSLDGAGATPTAIDSPTPAVPTPTVLEIVVMDVGQGDSTLIVGPEKTMLVDGGDEAAGPVLAQKLAARHVGNLDYVVATHPHADHIGGLDEVMAIRDVISGVFDNGQSLATQAFANYKAAAQATTGGRHLIEVGQSFELGQGVTVTCMSVNGHLFDGSSVTVTDPNDQSVSLLVKWGDFRFFVGGDLGGGGSGAADVETPLAPLVGDVDVVKINHHGSDTSTNSTWVNTLAPEVAIISDGDGNTYGHPDPAVLARLTGMDATVHVPPPELLLTEKGDAPSGYAGTGDVQIDAYQDHYVVGGKTYDAVNH